MSSAFGSSTLNTGPTSDGSGSGDVFVLPIALPRAVGGNGTGTAVSDVPVDRFLAFFGRMLLGARRGASADLPRRPAAFRTRPGALAFER